jgi:hypothetical protein
MAAKGFEPFLDQLHMEIRYEEGFTYLDRCGQTLIDIERQCPGWVAGDATPQSGGITHPVNRQSATFNTSFFSFSASRPSNAETAITSAMKVWEIIRVNLGVTYGNRLGCRFQFLRASNSAEEAEKLIQSSPFNVAVPAAMLENRKVTVRHPMVMLKDDQVEYRLELNGVHRFENPPLPSIAAQDPRRLSRGHRQAREDFLKQRHTYSRNPAYGVIFDVDCAMYELSNITSAVISTTCEVLADVVFEDFYPIIKGLK